MRNPLKAALARALDRRVNPLREQITRLQGDVEAIANSTREHESRVEAGLRYLLSEEAENCRRVARMRDSADYLQPYESPDPLVSIVVPLIRERVDLFLEQALPSALAQSHKQVEVIVVCDGFDPLTDPRLQAVDDPRVRLGWITQRVENRDERRHWLSSSTLAQLEARRMAAGLWVTELDDDDALPSDAIELLLAAARETRAEVVSGLLDQRHPDGSSKLIAGFPPEMIPHWSGLDPDSKVRATSAALVHHALSSISRQRTEDFFDLPGDLVVTIKMVRAGVRFATIDNVVYDYFPGTLWDGVRR